MNALDLSVAVALIGATVSGWRRGLVVRVCTAVGALAGLLLAAANLPWIVSRLPFGDRRPGFVSVLTALAIGAVGGRLLGALAGQWVRRRLPGQPLRQADRTGGALVGAAGVAFVVWLSAPLLAMVPGWPAAQWAGSRTGSFVAERFPPSPDALASLRFLLADASFPRVLGSLTGSPAASVPDAVSLPPDVVAGVEASTVTVRSQACGRVSTGTGTVVGSRLIITNAHVVAGSRQVTIDDGGRVLSGTVVTADPQQDLAMVRVGPVLGGVPLKVTAGTDPTGAAAAVGRGSGAARTTPVAFREVISATGQDIYDGRPVTRSVLVLGARLQPGDSGGPVVDAAGTLVGIVFARAADEATTGYAISTGTVRALIDGPARPDGASRCLG